MKILPNRKMVANDDDDSVVSTVNFGRLRSISIKDEKHQSSTLDGASTRPAFDGADEKRIVHSNLAGRFDRWGGCGSTKMDSSSHLTLIKASHLERSSKPTLSISIGCYVIYFVFRQERRTS